MKNTDKVVVSENEYRLLLKKALKNQSLKMKIAGTVLVAIKLIGLSAVAFAAPNALQLLKPFLKDRKYSDRQVRSAYNSLVRQKIVERVIEKNGTESVRISIRGKSRLRAFAIESLSVEKPHSWDGKWRIVMFDIPVGKDRGRTAFRFKLKQLGFVQFQRSAWIYPYPCEEELLYVADFFEVGKYIDIVTAESLLNDKKFRKHFDLL